MAPLLGRSPLGAGSGAFPYPKQMRLDTKMVMNYADELDAIGLALPGFYDEVPEGMLPRALTHASRLITRATRAAVYPVDPAGNPTDPAHIEIFREATCHQVEAWHTAGVLTDVLTGGALQAPVVTSTSENGASISLDSSGAQTAKQHLLDGGLAPAAKLALDVAGLLHGLPGIRFS